MKKLKVVLVGIVLSVTANNSYAQTVFNNVYSFGNVGLAVIQTLDGGYCTVGNTSSFSPFLDALFILKTDENGNEQWKKAIDLSHGIYGGEQANAVIQLIDSNYIVTGFVKDTVANVYPDVFLLKLDKYGDTLWTKRYGGSGWDEGHDIKQTRDGGFIIAADSYSFSSDGYSDAYIIKTDSAGNIQWQKAYYPNDHKYGFAQRIFLLQDGNYMMIGTGLAKGTIWQMKLDATGTPLWQKEIDFSTESGYKGASVIDAKMVSDGGFAIALIFTNTNNNNEAFLAKTDSLGNLQWHKRYFDSYFHSSELTTVTEDVKGGKYITAGDTYISFPDTLNGLALAVNSNGDSLWSKFYTKFGGLNQSYIFDIETTKDGGLIMCGYVFSSDNASHAWLLKTDCVGNEDKWDSVACAENVGIKEELGIGNEELRIYPNPATGSLTLTLSLSANAQDKLGEGIGVVQIYNVLGELVYSISSPSGRSGGASIDVRNLPNGIYFVQVRFLTSFGMTKVRSTKFVKE